MRNDGMPCDACLVDLPLEFLSKCPVTGAIICLACAGKPDMDDVADADRLEREDVIFDRLYGEGSR